MNWVVQKIACFISDLPLVLLIVAKPLSRGAPRRDGEATALAMCYPVPPVS